MKKYDIACLIRLQNIKKNGASLLNFFHFMIDLDQGPCVIKRLRGCGSGNEYVADYT